MKQCIIAEKPDVARHIASALNVPKTDGYYENDQYIITNAIGHLIEAAGPKAYVENPWNLSVLPLFPEPMKFQVNDDKKSQFFLIKKLFNECDEIVVATDAGREGEHIFRLIYTMANCNKPFKRLWISSVKEKAILDGMNNLLDGHDKDTLADEAMSRQYADWCFGINATIAFSLRCGDGSGPLSLGRVQTPTLGLIARRYLENTNFKPTEYFIPTLILNKDNIQFKASYQVGEIKSFSTINESNQIIKDIGDKIRCSFAEKANVSEKPPLPFNLNTLQIRANELYSFTASSTLQLLQSLYEKHRAVTYPRTDSEYIDQDVFNDLPSIFSELKADDSFRSPIEQLPGTLPKHCVNPNKVTDHHAVIPTGIIPQNMSKNEKKIFDLVVFRTIAAFSEDCEKEKTVYEFTEGDHIFKSYGSVIKKYGWRGVDKDQEEEEGGLPSIEENELIAILSKSSDGKKTKPPQLYTDASILKEMAKASKFVEEKDLKSAIKECGIGTSATRASIIETLLTRSYVDRKGKKLIPTEKGLKVFDLVKDLKVCSVELTAEWESKLSDIYSGSLSKQAFYKEVEDYVNDLLSEIKQMDAVIKRRSFGTCPKCKQHNIVEGKKAYGCEDWKNDDSCKFVIFKTQYGKTLSLKNLEELITKGETGLIKGLNYVNKETNEKRSFDACLCLL